MVFLNFNPKAEKDKKYLAQTHLPDTLFDKDKWKKILPYLSQYFSEFSLSSITEIYFCPYRTENENQLTKEDMENSSVLFRNWIKELSPKLIISFSNSLKSHFIDQNLLNNVEILELDSGKRIIKSIKGFIKNGTKKVKMIFLPSPGAAISKENKVKLWDWASK